MKFGIDLGTTYSCISYVDYNGEVRIIPNLEGETITPSVVKYRDKKFTVGQVAKNEAKMNPTCTVEMVKRKMGTNTIFNLDNKKFKPQEIASEILRKLVNDANAHLQTNCKEVVITVPAYFGEEERHATAEAARLAGLKLFKIIDEPTAAVISYQYRNNLTSDKTILVYDLGGGTFDVSLVKLYKDEGIKVLRHDGKKTLGGKDWDMLLFSYILEEYCLRTNSTSNDLLNNSVFVQTLTTDVEQLKRDLSVKESSTILVEDEAIVITRQFFEELTEYKLEETISIISRMFDEMRDSGKEIPAIDEVLMVGGSTHMPQVKNRLQKQFPYSTVSQYLPDEAVARGAAIYALDLVNVAVNAFKSYGIMYYDEELVEKNGKSFEREPLKSNNYYVGNLINIHQPLPQKNMIVAKTITDNQKRVIINIVENTYDGYRIDMDKYRKYMVKPIGSGTLELAPGLPKGSTIEVTFEMQNSTSLKVFGRDPASGVTVSIPIDFTASK